MNPGCQRAVWLPLALAVLAGGCVTREDIRGIQTDLYNIQRGLDDRLGTVKDQTDTVQTTQADLRMDMQELSQNLAALRAELQDNMHRMEQLSARLDDVESSLTARMDAQIELLSGSKFVAQPAPSTVYNLANTDFVRGRFAEAIKGFEGYIRQFPRGEMVPEAYLRIGDAHGRLNNWERAAASYDTLIKDHPKSRLVATSLLRRAAAYEELGRTSAAIATYQLIVKDHPNRAEARTARERLQALESTPRR